MKKILGLDLGSASIGWALIAENCINNKEQYEILGLGSRIIPYEGTEGKDFEKGTGETRNAIRTRARTARRGYDRYQIRRANLVEALKKNNMFPDEATKRIEKIRLWELRNNAPFSKIELKELGRILLWLNQKRGYKSGRLLENTDKKDTDYVTHINSRHRMIKDHGLTIGQYFYQELSKNYLFRVKEKIFPREAYIEEFDAIMNCQKNHYPSILTDELIGIIRNHIIYFQRPLKSQKNLVAICEYAGFWIKEKDGKKSFVGPKVAPKSSPLFQLSKIWENINNIRITDRQGDEIVLTIQQKKALFEFLDNNERLTQTDLLKILNLKRSDCYLNKQLVKGIPGNLTKTLIRKHLINEKDNGYLLQFDLNIIENDKEGYLYDRKTGEILNAKPVKEISPSVERSTYYQLWHTIYSIPDTKECSLVLQSKFGIEPEIADKLSEIDFTHQSYGNKSAKVIRKILPYLMEGDGYSEAMSYAGYDHSNSLTKSENLERKLLNQLKHLPKNSLRQPIVEKILNQMINVVNSIIAKYGKPDEIRIELARELKQSREERNNTDRKISQLNRENESISKRLQEFGLRPTRNNIIKWRLYEEINNKDNKLNAMCIYCGQPISLVQAITGDAVDVEHIIPKSKLFDDSQSNKTLAHRHCNKDKNDLTAYDFMKSKPEQKFKEYIDRVNLLFSNKVINKAKRDKLLMSDSKIPNNFIDRQLRESQYISRKAREILQTICYNVWTTTGTVTSELRHLWGWDEITMNLQLPKYQALGLTEIIEFEKGNGHKKHRKEIIKDWSKRDDQRHHAIDALTIACTKQGYIQRFNTLNATKTREEMFSSIQERGSYSNEKRSLLERYIISEQPLSVKEVEKAASNILISYKSGKRVAVRSKRKVGKHGHKQVVQTGILVPRGALREQNVYGKIKTLEKKPVKYLFEYPQLIFKQHIREKVEGRINDYDGDVKKAIDSVRNNPIYLDANQSIKLEFASCYNEEYVIKYKVDANFNKVEKIVDEGVKRIISSRLEKFGGKPKEAFKDVVRGEKILKWYDDEELERPIISVRCYTGLSAVVPVKSDESGKDIGFVKPGNNHHIAFYTDSEGVSHEHVCTFWHAVERKKFNVPVIIDDSEKVWERIQMSPSDYYPESFLSQLPLPGWTLILSMQQNEMFILGMEKDEIDMAIANKTYYVLSQNLYRVQNLASTDFRFRHHLETRIDTDQDWQFSKRFYRLRNFKSLNDLNPYKVKLNCIGEIV